MPSLIEQSGGSPQKQPKYVPVFIDRHFTGLYTQRNVLHDPSDVYTAKFYGGRPDALWQGSNVELTNRLTLQRRPGLSAFSTATYSTAPNFAFSFQLSDGTLRVIIDTGSTPSLVLTSVAAGTGVYTGTIVGGGSNAYVGLSFKIAGFTNGLNNGTFTCTASTATTLTLSNPKSVLETNPATAISAGAVFWDQQNGVATLLFAKSPGAGQTTFVAVAGILYMGNGVDTKKYTPLNTNGAIWNWGTIAPPTQPSVTITASGAAAVAWVASTVFTTMGLLLDSKNNVQQLNAVTLLGNTGQLGTTGQGQPTWNNTYGAQTTEVGGTPIVWQCIGQIGTRLPNKIYQSKEPVYDPITKCIFINIHSGTSQSGSNTTQLFNAIPGSISHDGAVAWGNRGLVGGDPATVYSETLWKPSQAYAALISGADSGPTASGRTFIIEPALPPSTSPAFLQYATNAGTSSSGYTPPWPAFGDASIGLNTADNQVNWVCMGSSVWTALKPYTAWNSNATTFSVIKATNADGSTTAQVCVQTGTSAATQPLVRWQANHVYNVNDVIGDSNGNKQTVTSISGTHTSGATAPVWNTTVTGTTTDNPGANQVVWTNGGTPGFSWGTNYGDKTNDGSVVWMCVGPFMSWAADTQWFLPTSGFSPPSQSNPKGGAEVIGSGFVQAVIVSGKSQSPGPPAWSTTIGNTTTDGGVTWTTISAVSVNSLVWKNGHVYAYSFKARGFDDFYSPAPLGGASIPPGSPFGALSSPTGSATNLVSTASPVFTIAGGNTGAVNTISGLGSLDPQIDTIIIWRDADGGGSGQMFELTEIPAPPPVSGPNGLVAQPWSFKDFLPDSATSVYPGLNTLIPAPINSVNNPPFANSLPMVYNFQRIWCASGQAVPFSGGPDTRVGNPNECFAPVDSVPFLAPVQRIVKTPQGLVTFLPDSVEIIGGGPVTSSFFSVTWAPGIGLSSYNALDVLAGEMYFFSADNQFRTMTPSLNIVNAGFALGDQFANLPSSGVSDTTWTPSKVYVASHQSGIDNCIFVSDGSTGWYRLNAHQAGANQSTEPVWSVYANITNGCKMVQSVQTSLGIKKLLVGSTLQGQQILKRDLSVFTDNGTQYDAFFVMGSITLAHPGQLALLKFVEFDFSGVGYQPTVSYLLNEVSGAFTPFTNAPQFDPPSIYGKTASPTSYSPNRYYFLGNASLARCRHLQLKVDFGTTPNGDEVFNATIFGRIMVET